ncbi:GNAT family N-acetyltransferase [Xenophilus sp. AP218F]|nr:GNAT family N-acetyltransferase [Chromobacterium sp. ASV5]OWY40102.1 GNAT family N-acetyltransferase [Xenophilus sp. AP218F]
MKRRIALATPESVPKWLPLFQAYLRFYRVEQAPDSCAEFLAERLRRRQAVAFVYGEDAPSGFALMYAGFSSLTLRPAWLLHDLYIAPEARRQGAGEALIRRCQQYARELGGGEITLQTAHDNLPAQALYQKTGFLPDQAFRVYCWGSDAG